MKSWHGKTTTLQQLYSFFYYSRRILSSACGTQGLFSWQGTAGQQQLFCTEPRPALCCKSLQGFMECLHPKGRIYSSVGDIKEPTSFLAHCITSNTFPPTETAPTLFGRKINGEASSESQRKTYCSCSCLSGKFWRLRRFTVCPLPAWEQSDAARNYYFFLCVRFTPCGCSLKSLYFPLSLK